MKSLEEIMKGLEYLSTEDVDNPKWSLDSLTNLHESLTDGNFMSYIVYLSLRPDLSDEDKDTCMKIIKIKKALEDRDIRRKYSSFEIFES